MIYCLPHMLSQYHITLYLPKILIYCITFHSCPPHPMDFMLDRDQVPMCVEQCKL